MNKKNYLFHKFDFSSPSVKTNIVKNLGTNICENCETPMHHLAGFGTNGNDTVNTEYCCKCY